MNKSHDSASGYAEGQRRVRLIIDSINLRLSTISDFDLP